MGSTRLSTGLNRSTSSLRYPVRTFDTAIRPLLPPGRPLIFDTEGLWLWRGSEALSLTKAYCGTSRSTPSPYKQSHNPYRVI